MHPSHFEAEDLSDERPPPGWHAVEIASARYRRSAGGNRMIQVSYAIAGAPGQVPLAEYFVVEGASPRGVALARRRLASLYRAAGLDPKPGEAIAPADLLGARLEIELVPETWQGRTRLRVASHRPRSPSAGGASS